MKKLLLIFLLMLLPFQFTWAAAAAYCQHDNEQAAQHFGHHEHQHRASTDNAGDAGKAKAHPDCGYCHLSCQVSFAAAPAAAVPVPDSASHIPLTQLSFSSHIPDGPKRPDWRLIA